MDISFQDKLEIIMIMIKTSSIVRFDPGGPNWIEISKIFGGFAPKTNFDRYLFVSLCVPIPKKMKLESGICQITLACLQSGKCQDRVCERSARATENEIIKNVGNLEFSGYGRLDI